MPIELDDCRRVNPQTLFAKRVICCESKTEFGFLRSIDTWLRENNEPPFSSKGIVFLNAGGGDKMYKHAIHLKLLGFDSCVFADDKAKELAEKKAEAMALSIPLYLCEEGLCLETQVLNDIPWGKVCDVLDCNQDNFPTHNIQVNDDLKNRALQAEDAETQEALRKEIAELALTKKKEWFKHIPGREFLARIVMSAIDDINKESPLKKNINALIQ